MKVLNSFLKIITSVSLAVYPLFYNLLGGAAVTAGAINNYRSGAAGEKTFYLYLFTGIAMLLSSVLMTSATVLVFGKKYMPAFVTDAAGTLLCILAVVCIMNTAAKNGITDAAMKPYHYIYAQRHFPTVIHLLAVAGICLPEYFGKRREEKDALHEFVYSNSGINDIMNFPDDDI